MTTPAARRIQAVFLEAGLHLRPPLGAWLGRAARIAAAVMRDINAAPVHRKSRAIRSTVEASVDLLARGKSIFVFPEDSTRRLNDVLCHFCTGFLPVRFDATVPFTVEKARLKRELERQVTELYRSMEDEGRAAARRA